MQIEGQTAQKKNPKQRVKVAIRVRPFVQRELSNNDGSCVQCQNKNHIILGNQKSYNFDRVFNEESKQQQIYQECVKDLVSSCFDGYNAAILAYGQTGSGKTYTMGTSFHNYVNPQQLGILPRVINHIFAEAETRKESTQFVIKASFLEIYNEQIIDLFLQDFEIKGNGKIKQSGISIRQQKDGSVAIFGANEPKFQSASQMLSLLQKGSLNRSTASTMMNGCSSRSHAIFTITIQQHQVHSQNKNNESGYITAKFYFVDLAGSQRAKKTGATGITFKQGVNINLGLLQLGNVISALSTIEKKEDQFITYRNSKLTRILQDCLGGNSNTYMIACVSPAESNYEESLNTLKYASKAMNIKNKPIVNRDPQSAFVSQLKQKIADLQNENVKLKSILAEKGVNVSAELFKQNGDIKNDMQLKKLKEMYIKVQKKCDQAQKQLKQERKNSNQLTISNFSIKRERDISMMQLEEIQKKYPNINFGLEGSLEIQEKVGVLQQYLSTIQKLEDRLQDKQKLYNELQAQFNAMQKNNQRDQQIMLQKMKQIKELTKQNRAVSKQLNQSKRKMQKLDQIISQGEHPNKITLEQKSEMVNHPQYGSTSFGSSKHVIDGQQDSQASDQQLEQDMTYRQYSQDFGRASQQKQNQIKSVSKFIEQKEYYLNQITNEQIELEKRLISQMKQEYAQRILMLEKERQAILHKKNSESSITEKNKLLNRNNSLEQELKQLRRKMQEQKALQFKVSNQNNKINQLRNQIQNFKIQKLELNKRIKQDKTSFEKFKKERTKQLLKAKKKNFKNELQLKKFMLLNSRNEQKLLKKNQEIKRVKKVNQALKTFSNVNKTIGHYKRVQPKMSQMQIQNQNPCCGQNQYEKIVEKSVRHILLEIDKGIQVWRYQQKIEQISNELAHLMDQQSSQQLKLDRLRMRHDQLDSEDYLAQNDKISLTLNDLQERIHSCQQNYAFCKEKCHKLYEGFKEQYDIDTEIIFNPSYNTVDSLRGILRAVYKAIRNVVSQNYQLKDGMQKCVLERSALETQVEQLNDQLQRLSIDYKDNLTKLREQMVSKMYDSLQQPQMCNPQNYFKPHIGIDERQKKMYQKKIQDLYKLNKQTNADLQTWRRKCEVIKDKYQSMRGLMMKDKFIGIDRQLVKEEQMHNGKDKKSKNMSFEYDSSNNHNNYMSSSNLQSVAPCPLKKIKSLYDNCLDLDQRVETEHNKNIFGQDDQFNKTKWNQLVKIDAHSSPVTSLANFSNILISTATKSVKLWDLETSKMIAELSGNNLNSFVKSVIFFPGRNTFATACDRLVTFWDIQTMNAVGTLKAHKEEVKAMHTNGNYFFTAGKGLANSGALLVWDLRNVNPNSPSEQKQRGQDIFSMTSTRQILYYGTRNHQVRRMSLDTMETLSPFEPPHMDTVTGLTTVKDYLVSGSKDKNLRLWSMNESVNHIKYTIHAFNDYITTLSTDLHLPIFYSGARDGKVKIGAINKQKMNIVGGITSHTKSVNAICPVDNNRDSIIATASSDKTIRIWQPCNQTVNYLKKQYE